MDVKKIGTSFCTISKDEILRKDFSLLISYINTISLPQIKAGSEDFSKIILSIDGYNHDSRSLWQIPEVIDWFKELHINHPYAPIFLTPGSVQIYFMILTPVAKTITAHELRDKKAPVALLLDVFAGRNYFFPKVLGNDYKRLEPILKKADKACSDAVINLVNGIAEPL